MKSWFCQLQSQHFLIRFYDIKKLWLLSETETWPGFYNGIAQFPYSAFRSFTPYSLEPDVPTPHSFLSDLIAGSRPPLVVTSPHFPVLLLHTLGFAHLLLCSCPIHNTCASVLIILCLYHLCLISNKCSFMYSSMCPVWLYQVKENSHSDIHPQHILHGGSGGQTSKLILILLLCSYPLDADKKIAMAFSCSVKYWPFI